MLIAVALGGAAGTLARYGLGAYAERYVAAFPYATLGVNVLGSLLLGALVQVLPSSGASPALRAALTIGLCGGFTTFSTFSHDTVRLLAAGSYGRAAAYVVASVGLSLLAVFAGFEAARAWLPAGR